MKRSDLVAEIGAGVEFWGWEDAGVLVGVMGLQHVRDVTLIRHAYVRPSHQSRGVGGALLTRFYERHGFRLAGDEEKDRLLGTYWKISPRQREKSVVLTRPPPQNTV